MVLKEPALGNVRYWRKPDIRLGGFLILFPTGRKFVLRPLKDSLRPSNGAYFGQN